MAARRWASQALPWPVKSCLKVFSIDPLIWGGAGHYLKEHQLDYGGRYAQSILGAGVLRKAIDQFDTRFQVLFLLDQGRHTAWMADVRKDSRPTVVRTESQSSMIERLSAKQKGQEPASSSHQNAWFIHGIL